MKAILVLSALALAGCTDAAQSYYGQFGDEAKIQCFSGGAVVYDGTSTGKVSASDSAGVYFREKASGKFVRLYADCIVKTL